MNIQQLKDEVKGILASQWSETPMKASDVYQLAWNELENRGFNADEHLVFEIVTDVLRILYF